MKTSSSPRIITATIASLLAITSMGSAEDKFWGGFTNGSWHEDTNWISSGAPAPGDTAFVDIAPTATINSNVTVNNIYVSKGSNSSGTLNVTSGVVNVANDFNFSDGANSTSGFNMSGGSITTGAFRLGDTGGGVTNATQTAGSITTSADFVVQVSGEATFNMTGGNNQAGSNLFVGVLASTTGHTAEFNMSGGTFDVFHEVRIGVRGSDPSNKGLGELNISSGTLNGSTGLMSARSFRVGGEGFGDGTLRVSGTAILNGTDMEIGENPTDTGRVIQTGGTVNLAGDLYVQMAGSGSYQLQGGTLAVNSTLDATAGSFQFMGGKLTRITNGTLDYNGNLVSLNGNSTLGLSFTGLDADKDFDISGTLDVNAGITFELANLTLPSDLGFGDIILGKVGILDGVFSSAATTLQGVSNPAALTFISQDNPLAPSSYNPATDSVYYLYKTDSNDIALHYNVVPEPSSIGLLAFGALGLLRRRNRR